MNYHYVWLVWSSAFLLPWAALYLAFPVHRRAMLWGSAFMAPFGLTEPLFVPVYWNPPSLFDLAQRTGFDIESIIFCFAIGGIVAMAAGAVANVMCRPDLKLNMLVGGMLFLGFYIVFLAGLKWSAPGYIEQVWNLPALSGIAPFGFPIEEFLFAFGFGLFWTGVYEHFTWRRSVAHAA